MIGANYAVFFTTKEAEKLTSPPAAISSSAKTVSSLAAGIRSSCSKSQEATSFPKLSDNRKPSQSESYCRLLSQSEYCYRVSDQSDSCHNGSGQSQNNRNSVAGKNNVYSTKQPIQPNVLRSVKSNESLFASLTLLCSQKERENQRLSKSSSTRECGTSYDMTMKVILLGDCSVGKTGILRTMSRVKDEDVTGYCNEFRDGEMADIVFRKDGRRTLVRIVDTGG
ncbi:hypothetical protein BsWGS_07699 [Bradybaena similaris]